MSLSPRYEEARDITLAVAERELPAIVARHLGKGHSVKVIAAPRADPQVTGPRGSIVVKGGGIRGKKVAELFATGGWKVEAGVGGLKLMNRIISRPESVSSSADRRSA
jgi:hypothetical protein